MAALCGLFVLEGRAEEAVPRPSTRSGANWALMAAALGLVVFTAWQLPKWHRLQALENLLRDRYSTPASVVAAFQQEVQRTRFNLIAPRMLCDYTAMRPEFQQESRAAAQEYIRRAPHRSGAYMRLAALAFRLDDATMADDILARARVYYPNSPQALLLQGLLALDGLTLQERVMASQWSAERVQGEPEAREVAVKAYLREGDYAGRAMAQRLVERLNALQLSAPDDASRTVSFVLQ